MLMVSSWGANIRFLLHMLMSIFQVPHCENYVIIEQNRNCQITRDKVFAYVHVTCKGKIIWK